MLPIRDDNPTSSIPYVTIGLIVLNLLIFVVEIVQPGRDGMERFIWKYGFVPAELAHGQDGMRRDMVENAPVVPARDAFGRQLFDFNGHQLVHRVALPVEDAAAVPAWINIFTCMYLHGGWAHLLGNMLYLWIFGNNIEDRLGPFLYFVFYTATGLLGNLLHTFFDSAAVPLVGASGAISGVMGAYILLYPHARLTAIIPIGWYPATANLPAWIFLGVYIVVQNLYPAAFSAGAQGGVAYWAHIGGFVGGAALIKLFPLKPQLYRPPPPPDDDADFVL